MNKPPDSTPDQARSAAIDVELAGIVSQGIRGLDLARLAAASIVRQRELQGALDAVAPLHEKLGRELRSLCEAEHYPAVITRVERTECPRAEVHIAGMSPVRAEVHPDVDPSRLRVGARCHVAKARNCILDVVDEPAPWRDIGVLDEVLDDERLIIEHESKLVVLRRVEELLGVELTKRDRVGFDRDAGLAYRKLPAPAGTHLFAAEIPEDDFSGLGGLDGPIRQLKRLVEFRFRHPEVARDFRLSTRGGVLLDGPPGNGKTRLGRCLASYVSQLLPGASCRFMGVTGSEDYSMWLGGSERAFRDRFDAVREAARLGPVVFFMDEVDAIGARRGTDHGGAASRILSTILGLMDGLLKSLDNVVLIGATNRADQLDEGLIRPGRLGLKIHIPAPGRAAATAILRNYLDGLPLASAPDELVAPLASSLYSPRGPLADLATVRLADGGQRAIAGRDLVSGALLEAVVRRASEAAAERTVDTGALSPITPEDLSLELDGELHAVADLLTPHNVRSYVPSLPGNVRVDDVKVRRRPGV